MGKGVPPGSRNTHNKPNYTKVVIPGLILAGYIIFGNLIRSSWTTCRLSMIHVLQETWPLRLQNQCFVSELVKELFRVSTLCYHPTGRFTLITCCNLTLKSPDHPNSYNSLIAQGRFFSIKLLFYPCMRRRIVYQTGNVKLWCQNKNCLTSSK